MELLNQRVCIVNILVSLAQLLKFQVLLVLLIVHFLDSLTEGSVVVVGIRVPWHYYLRDLPVDIVPGPDFLQLLGLKDVRH